MARRGEKGDCISGAARSAFESPKAEGVTGDDVGPLFKKKKFLDIAKYNVRDIRATRELYTKWEEYLQF